MISDSLMASVKGLRKESWLEGSSSMDIMIVVVEVDVNEGKMMVDVWE